MTAVSKALDDDAAPVTSESTRTVAIALAANLAVAVAKTVAGVISGSASMAAEAAHSWADTGNQAFVMIANRRSTRTADRDRPLGYGREAYVWSLLAAVGLFAVGGTVSVWHGVTELSGDAADRCRGVGCDRVDSRRGTARRGRRCLDRPEPSLSHRRARHPAAA